MGNENIEENVKEKIDKKREVKGIASKVTGFVAVAASIYHLYYAYSGELFALTHRSIHLAFIVFLGFLIYPFSADNKNKGLFVDKILSVLAVVIAGYVIMNVDNLVYRAGNPALFDWILGILAIILVLELTRRAVGTPLVIISVMFLIYAYFGPYIPGIFIHSGYSIKRIFSHLYLSLDGIFGIPLGVSADFIFLFILFGTFLEKSGAGEYFIDLAYSVSGKTKGGPAKASVLSSGLLGSISGSSVANAVTSGTFTIPLMKKTGYSKHFSAGTEAASSTAGQLMPPIMGAAAFMMAEFLSVEFTQIIKAAIVPAVLYFFSLLIMVHFHSGRIGLKADKNVPPFWKTFIKGVHLLLPLISLVVLLFMGYSPKRAIFFAILIMIPLILGEKIYKEFIKSKERSIKSLWEPVKSTCILIYKAFRDGAIKSIQVAIACAAAGIIVGTVTLTGLGLKLAGYIEIFANGRLLYGLIITMFAALILGIGLPTTAKYVVLATLVGPALGRLGVSSLIAAHLFILYFADDADITPPVSLTSFATAGLAGSKPIKTSIEAFKLGLPSYLIPFVFIYNPALILKGSLVDIVLVIITTTIGIIALSAAIQGFLHAKLNALERLILFIIAISLIIPSYIMDIIALTILAAIYIFKWRKTKPKSQES